MLIAIFTDDLLKQRFEQLGFAQYMNFLVNCFDQMYFFPFYMEQYINGSGCWLPIGLQYIYV